MIKYLIAIFLTTAAAYSQTIKTLGYNTTNGQVAYSGSNTLTFTNPLGFSNAATTRTNLGLGASWLTNSNSPATTNATNLIAGTLDDARLSTNVAILSNLPSWATTTNAATARTNLGVTVASNLPAPWSGGASSNSLLTADGAGGSAFVANRTTYLRATNVAFSNSITPTNIAGMSWTVSANKTYLVSVTAVIDQQAGGYDVRIQWPSALFYTNATNVNGVGVGSIGNVALLPQWMTNTNNLRLFTRGGSSLPQQATAIVMVATGTNGGIANFQVCQSSSNATPTTLTLLNAVIEEL